MPAELSPVAPGVVRVSWSTELQDQGLRASADEVRRVVESAFKGGSTRVETHVDPDDETAQRVATFAGLMREGVARGVAEEGDRIVYARLVDDTPLEDPKGFRSLLNSFLPRKRAISQLLIRSTDGRVLLCQLTYKRDYDLPGGVVEVSESPQLAVEREVEEELGLTIERRPAAADRLAAPVGWLGRRASAWSSTAARSTLAWSTRSCARSARSAPPGSSRSPRCARSAPTSPPGGSRRRCANLSDAPGPAYTESGRGLPD